MLEIHVHIASPARLANQTLTDVAHELDVVYKPEFQTSCYEAVAEVLGFIGSWHG